MKIIQVIKRESARHRKYERLHLHFPNMRLHSWSRWSQIFQANGLITWQIDYLPSAGQPSRNVRLQRLERGNSAKFLDRSELGDKKTRVSQYDVKCRCEKKRTQGPENGIENDRGLKNDIYVIPIHLHSERNHTWSSDGISNPIQALPAQSTYMRREANYQPVIQQSQENGRKETYPDKDRESEHRNSNALMPIVGTATTGSFFTKLKNTIHQSMQLNVDRRVSIDWCYWSPCEEETGEGRYTWRIWGW